MSTCKGFTLWLTGLSGAGKSTLATAVHDVLVGRGHRVEILDGDELRANQNKDLGFSRDDRDTNVRRIGFAARVLSRSGAVAITAAISPYRDIRAEVRREHEAPFVEVFVDCAFEELLRRDPKGLYAKALRGEVRNFTGVSDPYEPPLTPDVHVRTDEESVGESTVQILRTLEDRGLI